MKLLPQTYLRTVGHSCLAALTGVALLCVGREASAQAASMVYRLGKDTIAIEQFTRTATRLSGEMVQRSGTAVARVMYDMELGKDGRPVSASIKRMLADGTVPPNQPSESRFKIGADSVVREVVFADSVQRRAFAAQKALINFPTFVYGPTEILAGIRKAGGKTDSLPAIGAAGGPQFTGFVSGGADTVRLRGGAYAMVLRYDSNNRLLSVDGSGTTNKAIASRGAGGLDMASIAKAMKPTGTLSGRDVARGAFGQGGMVLVDYGRPQVRERTVWGGALVPMDSVWRAGANDATHLFTSRTLTFGSLVVPPGAYTLWIVYGASGATMIVNKGIGQWGTQYDAAQDLGRVAMTSAPTPSHVEELTVTVKSQGPTRGAIEFAWGPTAMTASFTATVVR